MAMNLQKEKAFKLYYETPLNQKQVEDQQSLQCLNVWTFKTQRSLLKYFPTMADIQALCNNITVLDLGELGTLVSQTWG